MDREQARLKREERKVKAKKEREKRRREEEKKQQMEREFQENGECCFFAPWWGKLMKIGAVVCLSFPGLYILFLLGIDFKSRLPGLLYLLFFVPSYVKDIRQLLFPVADVVINGKGILVQSFWTSPGQIMWESLEKISTAYVITPVGRAGLFVEGFDVKFKNKKVVSKGNFIKDFYFRLRSLEFFKFTCITVPTGIDSDKLWVAANYFYGEWEKKQRVEKLEALDQQMEEQKRQTHSKQTPKK